MLNTPTPLPVASSSSTHGYEEERETFLPPHNCSSSELAHVNKKESAERQGKEIWDFLADYLKPQQTGLLPIKYNQN